MAKGKESAKPHNPGLSILMAIMSFEMVVGYLWEINVKTSGVYGWISFLSGMAIPVFMMAEFIISEKQLKSDKSNGIWETILKMIVPLVGWAVIYWGFYKVLEEALYPGYELKIKDLVLQIATGNSPYLNQVMWYFVNRLAITLFFMLVILIASKFHNVIFIVIMAAALAMQYMGIVIGSGFRAEIAGCVGELTEMFPLAAVGFLLAFYGAMEKTRKWWVVTMILSLAVIVLLRYYAVFTDITGLGFAGVKRIVLAAALILLFAAPPLEKLPDIVLKVIRVLTKHALGVFCMHRLISALLHYFISHRGWMTFIETYSFMDCVITYVICYLAALLISLIPCRWTRMLVEND
ncbi:MAG: hypothetical protein K6A74_02995 [Lachnospiraceae bacterium]|nr:hypothetical protein [Lachnospiraceae bacterium]